MDLLVVGFPESQFSVIVTQETEDVDAMEVERKTTFYPNLFTVLQKLMDEYEGFDVVTMYGPKTYIEPIAETVKENFAGRINTVSIVGLEEM